MPSTSYTGFTDSVNVIGARTDDAGVAVTDLTAEEARFPNIFWSEGKITPTNSFIVQAQASPNMTVKVGSGTAKADYYLVAGDAAGEGNYIVRLDETSVNITIDAADASQQRNDEIWLVVRDNAYDSSARAVATFGYRKGDVGGAAPGADTSWKAAVKLATVNVPAADTTISSGQITDNRAQSNLLSTLIAQGAGSNLDADLLDSLQAYQFTELYGRGGALIGSPSSTTRIRMQAGTNTLTTNSSGDFTITLPSAFPTGLLTVIFNGGDLDTQVAGRPGSHTVSAIAGRAYNAGGTALNTVLIRVNWVALGW